MYSVSYQHNLNVGCKTKQLNISVSQACAVAVAGGELAPEYSPVLLRTWIDRSESTKTSLARFVTSLPASKCAGAWKT